MTTKTKTRKAPAATIAEPKRALRPKRKVRKIMNLIARWNWLEADATYQGQMAEEEESDALAGQHGDEQDKIESCLSILIPQDLDEACELLKFAVSVIKQGDRPDRGGLKILRNIIESLPEIHGLLADERNAACEEGMLKMRDYLRSRTGAVIEVAGDPYSMQEIGRGRL
jgi:hypothetical protein